MLDQLLLIFSIYLIEFMAGLLGVALIIRWLTYKSSKYDQSYYLAFIREMEKNLDHDPNLKEISPEKIEDYIRQLLEESTENLPTRSLRFYKKKDAGRKLSQFGAKEVLSMSDYVGGRRTIIHGVLSQLDAFRGSVANINFNN